MIAPGFAIRPTATGVEYSTRPMRHTGIGRNRILRATVVDRTEEEWPERGDQGRLIGASSGLTCSQNGCEHGHHRSAGQYYCRSLVTKSGLDLAHHLYVTVNA
jgi:hypothetical protein